MPAKSDVRVLVTGAAGIAGVAVSRLLLAEGYRVRMADVSPIPSSLESERSEQIRCDTRTYVDALAAVEGMQVVVHLAAWHSAHNPPVSDSTIFAVNVDGTFNVFEACRLHRVESIVFASSMAYDFGSVYGVTKVIGEDLCRAYHEMTGASTVALRYHQFIPQPYLAFGAGLLRNGVDRRDIAGATVASVAATLERRVAFFQTIVHTNHGMPEQVVRNFGVLGVAWCEEQVPGSAELLEKYAILLPAEVEQHDLSAAKRVLGWSPQIGFLDFLRDLKKRDAKGTDVANLWTASELPAD